MQPSARDIVSSIQNYLPLAALATVGGVFAAKDLVQLVSPGEISLWLTFFGIVGFAVLSWRRILLLARFKPLPSRHSLFKPFALRDAEASPNDYWPRAREAKAFIESLNMCTNQHMIISGPSGAGKSKFVDKILRSELNNSERLHIIDTYDNLPQEIITKLLGTTLPDDGVVAISPSS